MNAYEQNGQKRFDSGSVTVSYFPHIAPNTSSKLSVQQKVSDLETKLNQPQEIPLNEAVHKGDEFQKELSTCRSIQDKDERNRYKRKHLGAYSASGTFWTRDKDVPLEVKIKKYNFLMALDFDDEKDLEGLRNDLENLPWVYYAGLSAAKVANRAAVARSSRFIVANVYFAAGQRQLTRAGWMRMTSVSASQTVCWQELRTIVWIV